MSKRKWSTHRLITLDLVNKPCLLCFDCLTRRPPPNAECPVFTIFCVCAFDTWQVQPVRIPVLPGITDFHVSTTRRRSHHLHQQRPILRHHARIHSRSGQTFKKSNCQGTFYFMIFFPLSLSLSCTLSLHGTWLMSLLRHNEQLDFIQHIHHVGGVSALQTRNKFENEFHKSVLIYPKKNSHQERERKMIVIERDGRHSVSAYSFVVGRRTIKPCE